MVESADFNEIPAWVCQNVEYEVRCTLVTQDADGVWWGYQVEPNLSHQSWYENEVGRCARLGSGAANPDWISTIKRVK